MSVQRNLVLQLKTAETTNMKTRFETGKAYGEHPCVFRITGRDADSVECDYHGKKLHLGIFDLDGNEAVRYGRICTTAQRLCAYRTSTWKAYAAKTEKPLHLLCNLFIIPDNIECCDVRRRCCAYLGSPR